MIEIYNLTKEDINAVVELEEKYLLETIGYEMLANELHNKYAHFFVAKKSFSCNNTLNQITMVLSHPSLKKTRRTAK